MHYRIAFAAVGLLSVQAFAQEMPRGSFLIGPVQSRYQLVEQVTVDPVVSERYQRHFGMTHSEVVEYFSTLRTTTIPTTGTYTVWYTRETSQPYYTKRITLHQGERVFVDNTGTVVLRLKCGNPMVTKSYVQRTWVATRQPVEETVVETTVSQRPQTVSSWTVTPLEPMVTRHNMTWEDAATTVVLARAMNVTPDAVIALRPAELSTVTYYDLAPALLMSSTSNRNLADVYNMYTTGTSWLDIANQLAFPSSYWNPMSGSTSGWTNDSFENSLWQTLLSNYLYVPGTEFSYFNTQSIPVEQWLVASVLGREFNVPARDILTAYNAANGNWAAVEQRFIASPPARSYIRVGG